MPAVRPHPPAVLSSAPPDDPERCRPLQASAPPLQPRDHGSHCALPMRACPMLCCASPRAPERRMPGRPCPRGTPVRPTAGSATDRANDPFSARL